MSMSTNVFGIIPPDEKFERMKAVYDSCVNAGVPVPEAVRDFFGDEEPDEKGVVIPLDDIAKEYSGERESGFEIHLEDIAPNVPIVRFVNSW
jgi:hypothetical protein